MAVLGLSGVTVSVTSVDDFDQLSTKDANVIIDNHIIPACESKGVKLSSYGNHVGKGSLSGVEKYDEEKAAHQLFNVERIQKAFAALDAMVGQMSQYKTGSYGLKHTVENHQGEYISNGDLIVAMLLKGYDARFGKQTESMSVNCEFKVKALVLV